MKRMVLILCVGVILLTSIEVFAGNFAVGVCGSYFVNNKITELRAEAITKSPLWPNNVMIFAGLGYGEDLDGPENQYGANLQTAYFPLSDKKYGPYILGGADMDWSGGNRDVNGAFGFGLRVAMDKDNFLMAGYRGKFFNPNYPDVHELQVRFIWGL